MKTPSIPVFDSHMASVLKTRKLAETPDLTPEKRMRAAWSFSKHILPSKLLRIQHRIIILN